MKKCATIAADNSATAHPLMAVFGRTTLKQAEIYTKKADQKRLAGVATRLLVPRQFRSSATVGEKRGCQLSERSIILGPTLQSKPS